MNSIWLQQNRVLLHIVFWLGYLVLITWLLTDMIGFEVSLRRALVMGVFYVLAVYFNLLYLIDTFFAKGRFVLYATFLIFSILVLSVIRVQVDIYYMDLWDHPLKLRLGSLRHYVSVFFTTNIMILLTSMLRFMDDANKLKQSRQELISAKLEAELQFLKAQVNPHFLFNSLNNIYTLALMGSDKTAPTVMKLSEMMRYMLYEGRAPLVKLEKEIKYLHNFIELQQLKKEERQNIAFEIIGNPASVQIEPNLFIPFFENAFKHGNLDDTENGWVKSKMTIDGAILEFTIENNVPKEAKKDKVGGIGLENVKKRLDILYPEKHELTIRKQDDVFSVFLKINFS